MPAVIKRTLQRAFQILFIIVAAAAIAYYAWSFWGLVNADCTTDFGPPGAGYYQNCE